MQSSYEGSRGLSIKSFDHGAYANKNVPKWHSLFIKTVVNFGGVSLRWLFGLSVCRRDLSTLEVVCSRGPQFRLNFTGSSLCWEFFFASSANRFFLGSAVSSMDSYLIWAGGLTICNRLLR